MSVRNTRVSDPAATNKWEPARIVKLRLSASPLASWVLECPRRVTATRMKRPAHRPVETASLFIPSSASMAPSRSTRTVSACAWSHKVMGGWRELHKDELHDLYSSPSIIRMLKSRRMRWAGHVARMGKREMHVGYWWESQRERDH
jgi:hypothetical protein